MKNLSSAVLSLCLVLSTFVIHGQEQKIPLNEPDYNKPKIFQNLPDVIPVDVSFLSGLFTVSKGQTVTPSAYNRPTIASSFLRGEVVSKSDDKPSNLQARSAEPGSISSMILKLSDYTGANFSLSKISDPDGNIRYTGRIINFKSGDLFVLQNVNGEFFLIKKNFYDLVNE